MYKRYITFVAILLLATAGLRAQDAPLNPVQLEVEAQKVLTIVESDGSRRTELVPVDRVLPGETVAYTIRYSNPGERPADNVVINNPVPELMIYLFGSAEGEGTEIEFSADGRTFGMPADLTVSLPGSGSARPSPRNTAPCAGDSSNPFLPAGAEPSVIAPF